MVEEMENKGSGDQGLGDSKTQANFLIPHPQSLPPDTQAACAAWSEWLTEMHERENVRRQSKRSEMTQTKFFRFKTSRESYTTLPSDTKIIRVDEEQGVFIIHTSAGEFSIFGRREDVLCFLKQEFGFDITNAQAVEFPPRSHSAKKIF